MQYDESYLFKRSQHSHVVRSTGLSSFFWSELPSVWFHQVGCIMYEHHVPSGATRQQLQYSTSRCNSPHLDLPCLLRCCAFRPRPPNTNTVRRQRAPQPPTSAMATHPPPVFHGRAVTGDAVAAREREWLATNGLGGYASGTLAGTLERSYHGLLIPALAPPLGRRLLLAALDDVLVYRGTACCLSAARFAPPAAPAAPEWALARRARHGGVGEAVMRTRVEAARSARRAPTPPAAAAALESFRLDGSVAVFVFAVGDARVEKRVWMKRGEDAVFVRWKLVRGSGAVALAIDALVNCRDHHSRTSSARPGFRHAVRDDGARGVAVDFGALDTGSDASGGWDSGSGVRLVIRASCGRVEPRNAWVYGDVLARERERGLPAADDHVHAASLWVDLVPGAAMTVVAAVVGDAWMEGDVRVPSWVDNLDGERELAAVRAHEDALLHRFESARMAAVHRRLAQKGGVDCVWEGVGSVDDSGARCGSSCCAGSGCSEESVGQRSPPLTPARTTAVSGSGGGETDEGYAGDATFARLVSTDMLKVDSCKSGYGCVSGSAAKGSNSSTTGRSTIKHGLVRERRRRVVPELRRRPEIEQLVLAADQFVVQRRDGRSIMAGWHWFEDWSRDTFISVPGLLLVTGRFDVARDVILTWSKFLSRGMLPNRFPESGGDVGDQHFNTADGSLWYFEAVRAYFSVTKDLELLREIYSSLCSIISHYEAGTRFGIKQDPEDGLLCAGVQGVAVTWMDAVCDSRVFTPRIGKPIELSALWFNALSIMSTIAADLGHDSEERRYATMASRVELSFHRFWNQDAGYCYDVIDTGRNGVDVDTSLRPNQLLACSLQWSPLSPEQRVQVVSACAQSLLTSHAIRSLAPDAPGYCGTYDGDIYQRDAAYHNGTAWGWLMGPFVMAHLRAYGDRRAAHSFLEPMLATLATSGQGTMSELFDGDAPHLPRGCIAQGLFLLPPSLPFHSHIGNDCSFSVARLTHNLKNLSSLNPKAQHGLLANFFALTWRQSQLMTPALREIKSNQNLSVHERLRSCHTATGSRASVQL